MTADQLERAQQDLLVTDDLAPYAGQWVAIRDHRVIASAIDAPSLRADPAVGADDLLMPVPADGEGILIL